MDERSSSMRMASGRSRSARCPEASRGSALAPLAEDLSRIQDALGVEGVLDPAHEIERVAVLRAHVGLTHRARPVLPGHRAADFDREAMQAVGKLVRATDLVRVRGIDED